MKKFFVVFAAFALFALLLFGCTQKPSVTVTPTTTTGAGDGAEIDSSFSSFDASLNEVSTAESELDVLPNEFDSSLLNES